MTLGFFFGATYQAIHSLWLTLLGLEYTRDLLSCVPMLISTSTKSGGQVSKRAKAQRYASTCGPPIRLSHCETLWWYAGYVSLFSVNHQIETSDVHAHLTSVLVLGLRPLSQGQLPPT